MPAGIGRQGQPGVLRVGTNAVRGAWPDQTVADDLVVEHARLRIGAELAWHELVLDRLGKLAADSEHRAGS